LSLNSEKPILNFSEIPYNIALVLVSNRKRLTTFKETTTPQKDEALKTPLIKTQCDFIDDLFIS
jgi:hypothetical protein